MSRLVSFASPSKRMNMGVTLLLISWFCGGLLFVLPNHGGAGLSLPQNLMAWAVMSIIALWCICYPIKKRGNAVKITLPAGTALIIAGVVLWSIPLLWSPRVDWQLNALPKVLALWGLTAFYVLLLCATSCRRLRSRWLTILVLAALIQAGYGFRQLVELKSLTGGRPYGSFQQVNLLASFLATGMVCALWLFLHNYRRTLKILTGVALVILPAVLVILQSRAGEIGALLASIIILARVLNCKKQRVFVALLLIASGIFLGSVLQHFFPHFLPIVDKENSTYFRMYMLKLTWQLIQMHPFIGNGYGSFEALFGQLAQQTSPGLEASTVMYPHNELVYAWAEGGLVAVAGIFCITAGVMQRLWSFGGAKWVGMAFLLPIAVHMNLEYPLYQSITHGLTIIMLLVVCGDGLRYSGSTTQIAPTNSYGCTWLWRSAAILCATAIFIFMATGIQTEMELTRIENQQLAPLALEEQSVIDSLLNPYSQFDRLDFDKHVALLVRFNLTHDVALLNEFQSWAETYLQVHNDPSVYFSLLTILRAQQSPFAENTCQKAHSRWISDPRFICIKDNHTPPK